MISLIVYASSMESIEEVQAKALVICTLGSDTGKKKRNGERPSL